jgi:signal transduction histidine kinase
MPGWARALWRPPIGAAGDVALIRRAALVVAAQTAVAVAAVVAVVGLTALLLTTRAERDDTNASLRRAAQAAQVSGDPAGPPPGVWLLIARRAGGTAVSPGTPAGLAAADVSRLRPGAGEFEAHDVGQYDVYTLDRDGTRVVAAMDQHFSDRERERLFAALLVAGAAGILAAAVMSWLVAARAVRPLGSALAMQRRFVADASHELRTPLTIMHTRAQLLQRRAHEDPGDPAITAGLDRLVDSSRTLTEIVNDLLLSAELSGRTSPAARADLAEIAAAVAADFSTAAEEAGVTLSTDCQAPAPVVGVAVALRRAVTALADNALGHTGRGGTVTITARTDGQTAVLTVADDGEGIDPSAAGALTKRFARGPAASGAGRRFGLGLALVQEVVQSHRGELTLDGRPGAGTIAAIALPAAPPNRPGGDSAEDEPGERSEARG